MTMKRGTNLLNILMIYFNYLSNNNLPNASHNLFKSRLNSSPTIAFALMPKSAVFVSDIFVFYLPYDNFDQ